MTSESPDNTPGPLAGREVLLCVAGGIACYKAADLASKLVQAGAGVTVAMTEAARRFVGPVTFRALTRRAVHDSLWEPTEEQASPHLALTDRADVLIVAPATANVLAKLAAGLADDLVSALGLSAWRACPILLAPAMNTRMWDAPSTQANLQTLRQWGARTIGPEEGNLACRTVGSGRMSEPADILARTIELLAGSAPASPGPSDRAGHSPH
jgi:phosphopantothenoylcysteine decarboxylase/phosphopantothenate--cysteine ligase